MNTKPYVTLAIALFLAGMPFAPTQAATFLPISEDVTSLRGESKGDVYAASNSVVITAPVAGDIFAAGDGVDISGSSDSSIFAIGRSLSITGAVQDDVRAAGEIISIGSNIAHDLFAAGSTITIAKDSNVHGDAYLAGENITISGTIHGNVEAAASKLTVVSGAKIMGNLTVRGSIPIIEDGATISGKTTTIASVQDDQTYDWKSVVSAVIKSILGGLLMALFLMWAMPSVVANAQSIAMQKPMKAGLIGTLLVILFVPIAILLAITGIGIPFAVILIAASVALFCLASGFSVLLAGELAGKYLPAGQAGLPKTNQSFMQSKWARPIIGSIIITALSYLSIIGGIILLLLGFASIGSLGLAIVETLRKK